MLSKSPSTVSGSKIQKNAVTPFLRNKKSALQSNLRQNSDKKGKTSSIYDVDIYDLVDEAVNSDIFGDEENIIDSKIADSYESPIM